MLKLVTKILFCLLLLQNVGITQTVQSDSLKALLLEEKVDSNRARILLDLAWIYNRSDLEQLHQYALEGLAYAKKADHNKLIARGYNLIGIFHMNTEDQRDSALHYFEMALDIGRELGYFSLTAEALNNIGIIYFRVGATEKAFEMYQQAILIAEENNMPNRLCRYLNNMAIILKDQEEYDKALGYYDKALSIADSLESPRTTSAILSNIGVVYEIQKNYDKALEYYNKSLVIKRENNDKLGAVITICNIGSVNASLGKYELAIQQQQEGIDLAQSINYRTGEIGCVQDIAATYKEKGEYEKAIQYALTGLELAEQQSFLSAKVSLHQLLSECYANLREYEVAYLHQDSFVSYQDSLENMEKSKQVSELEVKYQLRQKETENQLLKEKQIRQQQAIRQRTILNIASWVILILLSWLAWSYYRSAQQKKRYNSILQQEVEDRTQELTQSNQELKVSNAELERFTYIASHDLKEPLRNMILFNKLIQTRLKDSITDEIREYFSFVNTSGTQLYHLIESTLEFSKINQIKDLYSDVNLKEVIQQVKQALQPQFEAKNAQVLAHDLPTINSNQDQLYLVFKNLIENGVKYNESEMPTVEIIYQNGEDHTFIIKDNGIGIDPIFHEQIFDMFARLHQNHTYPGTGLGLAIVRKILNRMKGEISLKSEVGKGTTFFINLPKN